MPKCVFALNEKHLKALGMNEGAAVADGRNAHVIEMINERLLKSEMAEAVGEYVAGFILGYQLRGYDNILDFDLTDDEIEGSIVGSFIDAIADLHPKILMKALLDMAMEEKTND